MRRLVLVTGLGMAAFLVACTSLLGDFDVDKTSASSGDGGQGDGAPTDGAPTTDAGGADAEGGLPLLRCRVAGQPTLLDKAVGMPFGLVRALRSGTQTRVVATKGTTNGFSVYTLNNNNTPRVQTVASGSVHDVSSIPGGIGVLVTTVATANPALALIKIPDSSDTPSAPEIIATSAGNNINGASFVAFGVDDYYVTATYPVGANDSEVRVARRKTAGSVATMFVAGRGPSDGTTRMRDIVRLAGHVLLFNDKGPDQAGGVGAGYVRAPEEPTSDTPQAVTPIAASPGLPVVTFSAAGDPNGTTLRLAAGEVDFKAGTAHFRAGGVLAGQAEPVDATKVPVAYELQSYFDAPIRGETKWVGTDVVAVGSGLSGKGLNFFWYDAAQNAMRAVAIGADALIPERTPNQATFAAKQLLGGIGDLDVVWAEDPGPASADGTLWTAQVACAR